MKRILLACAVRCAGSAALPAWAQKTVTFAYQDMMNPWRWVQQTGRSRRRPATRSTGGSSAAAAT